MKHDVLNYLLNPKKWWLPLLVIFLVSFSGVGMIALHTYTEAPPVADFISPEKNEVIISKDAILAGQSVFQKKALMEYGSMFGDGAYRGPDYTAEALHQVAFFMNEYYLHQQPGQQRSDEIIVKGIAAKVKTEIRQHTYQKTGNAVMVTAAQVYAYQHLQDYYLDAFASLGRTGKTVLIPAAEVKQLAAFFFWGAWVCGTARPGETYSYTHNWPFDESAGNYPSAAVVLWSIIGALGLIMGLGMVLYYHGRLEKLDDEVFTNHTQKFMTRQEVQDFHPSAIQKATYKFFYVAILLFALQVLAGILTVHDFVGFVRFFGYTISKDLPVNITRSWHVQLSILWISACWIGGSFFMMSLVSPLQKKGQLFLINLIFILTLLMVAGSLVGMFAGPKGLVEKAWYWIGHQGWEYVEIGKLWQIILGIIFIFWAIVLYRGIKPVMKWKQPWALPNWLVYATCSIILLLLSGFIATPKTNFVIADFWRWMVVHMWAEAFFEVFTTVLIGYFMVMMGLVSKQATIRVIYLATLLFLGSGLLGISHNFYWNAKPVFTMALGSVFSTLQVVPLVLLTLEAWRFSKLPKVLEANNPHPDPLQRFGFSDVFLFLIGVNFWNFFGAGVLGFIINLPIANYYEHGTYLTVNHGHAALMGVYGNLALAAVLFCSRLLIQPVYWRMGVIRIVFWSINIGLLLMVLLDLFPAGVYQFRSVVEKGLWYARSEEFIGSKPFQTLTWLRIIGGSVFTVGGVIPLTVFMIRNIRRVKESVVEHK